MVECIGHVAVDEHIGRALNIRLHIRTDSKPLYVTDLKGKLTRCEPIKFEPPEWRYVNGLRSSNQDLEGWRVMRKNDSGKLYLQP